MQVRRFTVGMFEVNSYLITDPTTGFSAIVDTGEGGDLLRPLQALNPAPDIRAILLTHAHVDHAGGLLAIQKVLDVPVWLPIQEKPIFDLLPIQGMWFGMPELNRGCGRIDHLVADGDVVELGALRLRVLSTPGHTPGHVCFYDDEDILTGDLLFAGSIGRTDLPLGDSRQMSMSLGRIMDLPLHLRVHPGHGPASTLRAEVESNPYLGFIRRQKGIAEPRRGWF